MIGRTQAEVTRKLSVIAERRGIDPAAFAANATVGDPDEVVAQAVELFDAGLDGLIFNLADNTDVEMISLAGETLTQAFGRLAR